MELSQEVDGYGTYYEVPLLTRGDARLIVLPWHCWSVSWKERGIVHGVTNSTFMQNMQMT